MNHHHKNTIIPLLRKAGMKATPGHIAILSLFQKSKKPMSAQDVIDAMEKHLDPATIYRCITKLKNNGMIRQIDLRQNNAYYEFFNMAHHHHIICTNCGRIEDITDCHLESTHQEIITRTKHFTHIRHHSLEFYGVCKKCNKQTTE